MSPAQLVDGVLAVARTQQREVTRQPVYAVVLLLGLTLVALSPALSVFSLGPAEVLVLDLGASTLLFVAVFLAAAAVAAGTSERLSDGTLLQVLTRPIGPVGTLLGTWLGASAALLQAALLMGVALQMAVRHGPHRAHWGVLVGALLALGGAAAWGVRQSLRERPFQPAALTAGTVLLPACYLLGLLWGPDLSLLAEPGMPDGTALAATWLAAMAAVAYAGLGLALATRLPPEGAAVLTLVGFLLGSVVQAGLGPEAESIGRLLGGGLLVVGGLWLLAQAFRAGPAWGAQALLLPLGLAGALGLLVSLPPAAEQWALLLGTPLLWLPFALARWDEAGPPLLVYAAGLLVLGLGATVLEGGVLTLLVPDLQLFWIADAAYTGQLVPLAYCLEVSSSALLYALGALAVGGASLLGRELG